MKPWHLVALAILLAAIAALAILATMADAYTITFGCTMPVEDNIAGDCSLPEVRAIVHHDSLYVAWIVLGTTHADTIRAARGTHLDWRYTVRDYKPYVPFVTPLRLTRSGFVPACRPAAIIVMPKP